MIAGNLLPSLIRTYVPLLVAWGVGILAAWRIDVSTETQAALSVLVGGVVAAGYYALATLGARRWPALRFLLGSGKRPTYDGPTLSDFLPGFLRTVVPLLVGVLGTWLASLGITVDDTTSASLVTSLGGLLSAGYYALLRVLEARWPALGVFLGYPSAPRY